MFKIILDIFIAVEVTALIYVYSYFILSLQTPSPVFEYTIWAIAIVYLLFITFWYKTAILKL